MTNDCLCSLDTVSTHFFPSSIQNSLIHSLKTIFRTFVPRVQSGFVQINIFFQNFISLNSLKLGTSIKGFLHVFLLRFKSVKYRLSSHCSIHQFLDSVIF